MAIIIDGRKIAFEIQNNIKDVVRNLSFQPGLAVIRIGSNVASAIYVDYKHKACEMVGFQSWNYHLPETSSQKDVQKLIKQLNKNKEVHGILLQFPLPDHLNSKDLIELIDPKKDVDGLHPLNLGKLFNDNLSLGPCTPLGCMHLIKTIETCLQGKNALIVGRSNLVGKPLVPLLLRENCTTTIAHSKTLNLPELCQSADILIAAVGQPQLIKGEWIKPNSIVIDVGITRNGKQTVGDVETLEAAKFARAITPVPGGVGPMTIAYLLKNTLKAALSENQSISSD